MSNEALPYIFYIEIDIYLIIKHLESFIDNKISFRLLCIKTCET
jgi:hypothetical protein